MRSGRVSFVFEFSVLRMILQPQPGRRISALIALLASGVIALVVWLVILFFSVTEGLERNWIQKLTSLHGTLRVVPTEAYFHSYHWQSLQWRNPTSWLSAWNAPGDPYRPYEDPELPPELEISRADPHALPLLALKRDLSSFTSTHQDLTAVAYQAAPGMLYLAGRSVSFTQPILALATDRPHPQISEASQLSSFSSAKKLSYPILLPKSFADAGALRGDRGEIRCAGLSGRGATELHVPITVAGFYDAGIMAVGARILFTTPQLLSIMTQGGGAHTGVPLQGIQLHTPHYENILQLKQKLISSLDLSGQQDLWQVEAFTDYDFAQDLLHQFASDRLLFSLISILILLVACANIISFLVLIVHERRREIGILRAMGASSISLAAIFGGAGVLLGVVGALVGTLLALLTLFHLDTLLGWIGALQGRPLFQIALFGGTMPNTLSISALRFIWVLTPLLAALSGLIPALRACQLQPTHILKGE